MRRTGASFDPQRLCCAPIRLRLMSLRCSAAYLNIVPFGHAQRIIGELLPVLRRREGEISATHAALENRPRVNPWISALMDAAL